MNNSLTSEPQPLEIEKTQEIIEDLDDINSQVDPIINEELESDIKQDQDDKSESLITVENQNKLVEDDINWISRLHQFCQIKQIDYPIYDFGNIDSFFSCIIKLDYLDKIISAQGYGKSKKDAKKNASKLLMIQHNLVEVSNSN